MSCLVYYMVKHTRVNIKKFCRTVLGQCTMGLLCVTRKIEHLAKNPTIASQYVSIIFIFSNEKTRAKLKLQSPEESRFLFSFYNVLRYVNLFDF